MRRKMTLHLLNTNEESVLTPLLRLIHRQYQNYIVTTKVKGRRRQRSFDSKGILKQS
jgi:hypothetical protein